MDEATETATRLAAAMDRLRSLLGVGHDANVHEAVQEVMAREARAMRQRDEARAALTDAERERDELENDHAAAARERDALQAQLRAAHTRNANNAAALLTTRELTDKWRRLLGIGPEANLHGAEARLRDLPVDVSELVAERDAQRAATAGMYGGALSRMAKARSALVEALELLEEP